MLQRSWPNFVSSPVEIEPQRGPGKHFRGAALRKLFWIF